VSPATRCNVLLIHTDQQRYDSLGCCGNPCAVTPNLDALARAGTVFHRHIATNSVSMPSRASLLTGRYPSGHGVWANGVPLPRSQYVETTQESRRIAEDVLGRHVISHVPTMADVLAAAGYHTGAIGKLHLTPTQSAASLGYEESRQRWQEPAMAHWHGPYYGFQHVEMTIGHGEGVGGHYGHWRARHFPQVAAALESARARRNLPFAELPGLREGLVGVEAHHSTWIAQRARAYLQQRDAARPFFLFLGFPDPHHPIAPPAELARQFAARDVLASSFGLEHRGPRPQAVQRLLRSDRKSLKKKGLGQDAVTRLRQYTDAQVHLIDRAVGTVLETIEDLGLWDGTIVIFTSDHGDFLGDHGLITKANVCCNALNRVPLLLRIPGRNLPAETHLPMGNADVLPTLCEALGIGAPEGVQGRSIFEPLRADSAPPVFVQCYANDPQEHNLSIYDRRYRLTIYPATGERELYDHEDDPQELSNLTGDAARAADEEQLHRTLLEAHARLDSPSAGRVAVW
jgi:arylsulfatase A-like enzyme